MELQKRKKKLRLRDLEYSTLLILEDSLRKEDYTLDLVRKIFQEILDASLMFKGWSLKKSVSKDIGKIFFIQQELERKKECLL
ncbi:MAG: hypothetical protein ACTSRG_24125 [Candidatus Helarchaeota archaeon]